MNSLKTAKLPDGFPVGRLRLSRTISRGITDRATGSVSRLPGRMISPLGGQAPTRTEGSTLSGDVSKIKARGKGTLSELVSSKATEKNVVGDRHPSVHHGEILPPDGGADVSKGNGTVRDAEPASKVAFARKLLKAALMVPAQGLTAAKAGVRQARNLASSKRLGIGPRLSPARAGYREGVKRVGGGSFAPAAGDVPRGGPIRPASQRAIPAPSGGAPAAAGAHMVAPRPGPAAASPFKLPVGSRAWSPPQEAGSMTMTNVPRPR